MFATFVVGELLAHPFELMRRKAHVTEAAAWAAKPDRRRRPSLALPPNFVHPLTLRFSNEELERSYATWQYDEALPLVVAFCIFMTVLLVVDAVAFPAGAALSLSVAPFFPFILMVRLRRASNAPRTLLEASPTLAASLWTAHRCASSSSASTTAIATGTTTAPQFDPNTLNIAGYHPTLIRSCIGESCGGGSRDTGFVLVEHTVAVFIKIRGQ